MFFYTDSYAQNKIQYYYYLLRNTHRFTSPQFLRSASFLGGGRMYTGKRVIQ
jgi:hypothetical protein